MNITIHFFGLHEEHKSISKGGASSRTSDSAVCTRPTSKQKKICMDKYSKRIYSKSGQSNEPPLTSLIKLVALRSGATDYTFFPGFCHSLFIIDFNSKIWIEKYNHKVIPKCNVSRNSLLFTLLEIYTVSENIVYCNSQQFKTI